MKIKSFFKISFILAFFISLVSFVACKTPSPKINLTYSASQGGEIIGEVNQSVECGASGTEVTAQAYEGYEFVEWSDGVTTATRIDESITKDISVTAKFNKLKYKVSYTTDGNGKLQGETNQTVKFGENATTVKAVSNEGYYFVKWSDGLKTETRTDTNIKFNITVIAEFAKLNYLIKYSAGANGRIQGETEQKVKYLEQASKVVAIPNEGYEFVQWSDGIKIPERTDTVTSLINVVAIFEKKAEVIKTFTVNYKTDGNGTIHGKANQTVEQGSDSTTVTAIPDKGYKFVGWSDGVTTAARAEKDIQANIEVTANFEKLIYTVSYSTDGNGTIQGEANQTVEYGDSATSVTAVPNVGCQFVGWSDGITTATRTDVDMKNNITVVALFDKKLIRTQYVVNNALLGSIQLLSSDSSDMDSAGFAKYDFVKYGEDGPKVKAIPDEDSYGRSYVFIGWSDGVTTAERQDLNVTSEINVVAYFGYSAEYKVNGNLGGKIKGDIAQAVLPHEISKGVVAIPGDGYMFAGWSDLSLEPKRQDTFTKNNIEIFAYFEPIEKTFKYDYGIASGKPTATQITLNRNDIQSAEFVVPTYVGYSFCGWYADKEYITKVANETGRYMYGYAAFSLETDTLYAKWQKEGEEIDTHKILLVFVDEVQTELYSSVISENIKVYSKMSALDYEMSKWVSKTFYDVLCEWFKGEVAFEVDSYFTTKVVKDGFSSSRTGSGNINYSLFASGVSEVFDLIYDYHNILVTASMNDYPHNLHRAEGVATSEKEAFVSMEGYWAYSNQKHLKEQMDYLNFGDCSLNDTVIMTHLHEFAHTAELNFHLDELHTVLRAIGQMTELEAVELFLRNEFEMDGIMCGIPPEYWTHNYEVSLYYGIVPIELKDHGKIVVNGENDNRPSWMNYVTRYVHYGSDFSVEATPDEGYRFVKWSDGITTAIRHDENIISRINVEAIFEKI